jgi:hypothetical protein
MTETNETGYFSETIPLAAGTHTLQAFFNDTMLYPVYPSGSQPQKIELLPALSMKIHPVSGIYRDNLTIDGTMIKPENLEGSVDIYIDNNYVDSAESGILGNFRYDLTIDRLTAGEHTATARYGNLWSDAYAFHVVAVPSYTTLAITRVNNSALFECAGRVMAFNHSGSIFQKPETIVAVRQIIASFWRDHLDTANQPVISAPVMIKTGSHTLLETQTNENGSFYELATFPEGEYKVYAEFVNTSFPVYASQSSQVVVDNTLVNLTTPVGKEPEKPVSDIVVPLAGILIVILFMGGALYYLRRMGWDPLHPAPTASSSSASRDKRSALPHNNDSVSVLRPEPPATPGPYVSILQRYADLLHSAGLGEASHAAYSDLAARIARDQKIARYRALTPREMAKTCRERPYCGPFSRLVPAYERIRYAGHQAGPVREQFEASMQETDSQLGGGDH